MVHKSCDDSLLAVATYKGSLLLNASYAIQYGVKISLSYPYHLAGSTSGNVDPNPSSKTNYDKLLTYKQINQN